jgi:ubiquinone/menaquinone biosynthesis C-methylase UbiE
VPESGAEQARRHRQRGLFDAIAGQYEQARPGYPAPVVDFVAVTAGLGPGATVLEIGCGTGQLTERLAGRGYRLTAIDVGSAMIAVARERLAAEVAFQVTAFEDFERAAGSFGLIISGAAFHWIDPDVALTRSARLLAPGGWLALLGTEEHYGEPVGAALDELWVRHGDTGGAWQRRPSDPETVTATGLFGPPETLDHRQPATLAAEDVVALESTRATFLGWAPATQRAFTADLRQLLEPAPVVSLTRHTSVTMAPVAPG